MKKKKIFKFPPHPLMQIVELFLFFYLQVTSCFKYMLFIDLKSEVDCKKKSKQAGTRRPGDHLSVTQDLWSNSIGQLFIS